MGTECILVVGKIHPAYWLADTASTAVDLTDNRSEAVARNRRDTHLVTSVGRCNSDWPIRVLLAVPLRRLGPAAAVRTRTDVCPDMVVGCLSWRRYFLKAKGARSVTGAQVSWAIARKEEKKMYMICKKKKKIRIYSTQRHTIQGQEINRIWLSQVRVDTRQQAASTTVHRIYHTSLSTWRLFAN